MSILAPVTTVRRTEENFNKQNNDLINKNRLITAAALAALTALVITGVVSFVFTGSLIFTLAVSVPAAYVTFVATIFFKNLRNSQIAEKPRFNSFAIPQVQQHIVPQPSSTSPKSDPTFPVVSQDPDATRLAAQALAAAGGAACGKGESPLLPIRTIGEGEAVIVAAPTTPDPGQPPAAPAAGWKVWPFKS